MLKISGNQVYWKGEFQKGTLIKTRDFVQFHKDVLEGDYYNGWICPGLVNAHCHLELSHLKSLAVEVKGKGMAHFIRWIQKNRNQAQELQNESIIATLNDFQKEGTFIIGDICNSLITKDIKQKYVNFYFRNFWEVFGLNPEISEDKWQEILRNAQFMSANISLHAPYSCSKSLIEKVQGLHTTLQSIHIAESDEEIAYFNNQSLELYDTFMQMGVPSEFLKDKLPYPEAILSVKTQQYLLVHNVFLDFFKISKEILEKCYFCICPTSNLFLHKKTVSVDFIQRWKTKICLGTDSYASNHQLSVLNEMNYLKKLNIDNQSIVLMATFNAYKALLIPDDWLNAYHHVVHIYEDNQRFKSQILWI